jgi:hypothetical protein
MASDFQISLNYGIAADRFDRAPARAVVSPMDRLSENEVSIRRRSAGSWRTLMDEDGRVWRVREVTFADAAPSLVFESEAGFRRVRAYPGNWQAMSDSELYELSWRT